MKLNAKKGGHGYVTAYIVNIGSKEARDADMLNPDGTSKELVKRVEPGRIIIEVAPDQPAEQ